MAGAQAAMHALTPVSTAKRGAGGTASTGGMQGRKGVVCAKGGHLVRAQRRVCRHDLGDLRLDFLPQPPHNLREAFGWEL